MRKNTLRLFALALTSVMLLSGCGGNTEAEKATPEPTAAAQRVIEAPGFEKQATNAKREANGEKYMHDDEGYYLLADEGYRIKRKTQHGGTCWVFAASSCMESTALVQGREISVDPFEIVNLVYGENKTEGIIPERINPQDYGGKGWHITEALSNGFGDMLLTKAIFCYNGLSIEDIQELIRTNGAVTCGITDDLESRGYYDGYLTQFGPPEDSNHKVVIVGWDDNFPKEYFKRTPSQN